MFTFVHASDLHLGRNFLQFPADLAARLAEARFDVIGRVAKIARGAGSSSVLLAGDTWDSETPSDRILRQSLDRFAEHDDLCWYLLPGNHDPVGAGGLWNRIATQAPANVVSFTEQGPFKIEPGVWVLAAPCQDRPSLGDPTGWMSAASTPPGAHRIGLAHGSMLSFGETSSGSVIDTNRAVNAGLDYLALGDWHGWTPFGDRTIYPGTPEPDRFRDNAGFSALVTLSGQQAAPEISRRPTAQFHWLTHSVDPANEPDPTAALDRLIPATVPRREVILSLALGGIIRPEDKAVWQKTIEDFELSLSWLEVDQSQLTSLVRAEDLDLIDRQGALRAAADALLAASTDQDQTAEDRATASLALDLLFTWSASHEGSR